MSDDLNKLAEDFRALGRKEGAVHPATEEHYTNKERARWVAAVKEVSPKYMLSEEEMETETCMVHAFVYELLTRMEAS